jgi:glycosyltransferase involved in cell wall biosynthesis
MPECVDRIFVVDDQSTDDTAAVVAGVCGQEPSRVVLIRHAVEPGRRRRHCHRLQGRARGALRRHGGHGRRRADGPDELPDIVGPVARGECDYTKGNRLFSGEAWNMIPRVRYLGNAMLSLLTKIASGYWHVADSQSGYTAISLKSPGDHRLGPDVQALRPAQ